jgi:hypothetical protein
MQYDFGFVTHNERLAVVDIIHAKVIEFVADIDLQVFCISLVGCEYVFTALGAEGDGVGVFDRYLDGVFSPDGQFVDLFALLVEEGQFVAGCCQFVLH